MLYRLHSITHVPSGNVEHLESASGCSYQLADGSLLRLHSAVAWCRACRRFVNAESLESVEQMERQLEQLQTPEGRKELGPMFASADPDAIAELQRIQKQRLEWRRTRVTPAKCLECGSAEIALLPWDRPVPHPGGTGEIVVHLETMGGISVREETLYSPEGDRISGDEEAQI